MEAFYDLSKSPATHDMVNWLVRAEEARIAAGAPDLQVRFVPGVRMTSIRDKFYTPERRNWRVQHLLTQLAWLLPSVTDVSMGSGEQTLSYANPGEPKKPIFKAPAHAMQIVSDMLPKNSVSITLRQSDFEPLRNSKLGEWLKVASWLKNNGYNPIIVPDAEADMRGMCEELPYYTYRAAAHCFALKLALYEQCPMNLMINSGTMLLGLHSDIRMMAFKLFVDGVPCCSESWMRKAGFTPDHNWGPHKHLFWEDDSARNILPEIQKHMTATVERMRVAG